MTIHALWLQALYRLTNKYLDPGVALIPIEAFWQYYSWLFRCPSNVDASKVEKCRIGLNLLESSKILWNLLKSYSIGISLEAVFAMWLYTIKFSEVIRVTWFTHVSNFLEFIGVTWSSLKLLAVFLQFLGVYKIYWSSFVRLEFLWALWELYKVLSVTWMPLDSSFPEKLVFIRVIMKLIPNFHFHDFIYSRTRGTFFTPSSPRKDLDYQLIKDFFPF